MPHRVGENPAALRAAVFFFFFRKTSGGFHPPTHTHTLARVKHHDKAWNAHSFPASTNTYLEMQLKAEFDGRDLFAVK